MTIVRVVRPQDAAAIGTIAVAAVSWIVLLLQMGSMAMGSSMGLRTFPSFITLWVVMMAAMMLPSAVPMVSGFAGRNQERPAWPVGAALVVITYLLVWTIFGAAAYLFYGAVQMAGLPPLPWHGQALLAGIAIAFAGVYASTPFFRARRDRSRALCRDGPDASGSLYRSGLAKGLEYGLNCVGCTVALMIPLLVLGVMNLAWMVLASVLVLLYKTVPLPLRWEGVLSLVLIGIGVWVAAWPASVPSLSL